MLVVTCLAKSCGSACEFNKQEACERTCVCVCVCVCVCACVCVCVRVASDAAGSSGAAASSRHEDENANWLPHLLYGQRLWMGSASMKFLLVFSAPLPPDISCLLLYTHSLTATALLLHPFNHRSFQTSLYACNNSPNVYSLDASSSSTLVCVSIIHSLLLSNYFRSLFPTPTKLLSRRTQNCTKSTKNCIYKTPFP